MNILLGVTGSVASCVTPRLVETLGTMGEVQLIATKTSLYFWPRTEVSVAVWTDADEWSGERYVRDQPIPHIGLRQWADVFVIAPLSANTLAKLAHGLADNLLTCTARAWSRSKRLVVAPAMNTEMWNHPATAEHLATLQRWYGQRLTIVLPVEKRLACGEVGMGAMASVEVIKMAVR